MQAYFMQRNKKKMYKSWVAWIDKHRRTQSKTSNVQITAKKIKEWFKNCCPEYILADCQLNFANS